MVRVSATCNENKKTKKYEDKWNCRVSELCSALCHLAWQICATPRRSAQHSNCFKGGVLFWPLFLLIWLTIWFEPNSASTTAAVSATVPSEWPLCFAFWLTASIVRCDRANVSTLPIFEWWVSLRSNFGHCNRFAIIKRGTLDCRSMAKKNMSILKKDTIAHVFVGNLKHSVWFLEEKFCKRSKNPKTEKLIFIIFISMKCFSHKRVLSWWYWTRKRRYILLKGITIIWDALELRKPQHLVQLKLVYLCI